MKKLNFYNLILVVLMGLFVCCTTEIDNTDNNKNQEPEKKSYMVSISNVDQFSGCTFEYTFYVDGEKTTEKKTADSSFIFETTSEEKVTVDIVAKDSNGEIKGSRYGRTCYTKTDITLEITSVTEKVTLKDISVLHSQAYVYEGKTVNLTVKAKYSDDTEKDVTSSAFYTSNDSTILTVDESGVITGVAKGTCSIKITYTEEGVTKEKSVNFEVLAEGDPTPVKTLKSIALSRDNLILAVGGNASLNVTAYYDDGSSIDVTSKAQYTSEKIDISSVDGNGVITGISGGTTTILVSYEEDGVKLSGTCAVTVKSLSSIAFDKTAKTIAVGSHSEIILTATYSDGSTKAIANDAIFESDNNSIVSISDGMFEAKAAGKAKIKASYTDSGVTMTAEIAITVTMDKVVSSLALSVDGTKVTYTLKATASYSDGSTVDVTDKTIYTIVTGSDIAALSSNVLTASKNGTVTISATYKDGSESVSCQKEVNVQTDNVVLSDIALNLSETSIEVGKTASVTVNASYSDGTTKDVTAEAKVEISGTAATLSGTTVTGASAGKATVTATYDGKTASASITVKQAINGYRVHFYGASWSSYNLYYYSATLEKTEGAEWPGKAMSKSADGNTHYIDLTESWVAGGDTLCIFTESSSSSNRYPVGDSTPGIALPSGTNEAWFNFATKEFETANPFSTDPTVGLSPSGNVQFSGAKQSVKLTAANCTSAKYTTDGSDPKSSGTAYTDGETISVGESLSIGQSVTVKVWGTDGSLESTASATFTKVDKPATPTRLGAYYTSSATAFSIWSPDSSNVTVTVTPKDGTAKEYTCTAGFKVDGGYPDTANIYGVSVSGDLHLAEYQFKINGKAVRDPYGKMVKYSKTDYPQDENVICDNTNFYTGGPVGSSWAGSSVNIVVDAENILPTDGSWATRPALASRTDAIVYEVHVQDFTSSSTWNGTEANRGKFPGMVENGTTYTSGSTTVKTGLDHLKELGVTHVQIMPMYDFATKYVNSTGEYYNWGYDPVNYNVPEDRYSTCPGDYVKRIREVKDMINEFHKNGIRVIMDVVYNHTFATEMFKNISTKYYTTNDLSGCGNSIDVSNAMVSRMVRDSLEYWAEVYDIDGFRFDLMAIFTKDALYDWGTYLNTTNAETSGRNLLLQGEPWQCNNNSSSSYGYASAISSLANAHIGCFAGKFRETMKGSSDDGEKLGYIFSGRTDKDGDSTLWNTTVGIRGSGTGLGSDNEGVWTRYFTSNPEQAVNYLMAHDNLCFYDKIAAAGSSYTSYADAIIKFGHGILLVSQGIPFIHAGDEFLRTKAVGTFASEAHNSYMWGIAMNQIDWSYKAKYIDCFNYHKDMIEFRKNNDGLRYRNGVGSTEISGNVIYYNIQNSSSSPKNASKMLTVVINPGSNITVSGKGTQVMNKTGAVSSSSTTCEGTGVTIFAK